MKAAILDYANRRVDIIDLLLPRYTPEEVGPALRGAGYDLAKIAWVLGESIPVTYKTLGVVPKAELCDWINERMEVAGAKDDHDCDVFAAGMYGAFDQVLDKINTL